MTARFYMNAGAGPPAIDGTTGAVLGYCTAMKFGIDYIRETFGEVYPSFHINFGMMDKAKARRSIELFARHVMPRFR